MTSPLDGSPPSALSAEAGERIAPELDGCGAVLVIGDDPVTAAEVALGIGRVQARRRRVAVGDVVGELRPIEQLVPTDVAHGLVDSFLYGVSLNQVAHPVDPARNLYVLPSGAAPIDHEAILASGRWPQLVKVFREAGALLLLVVPQSPALASLAALVDGAVLVGDVAAPAGVRVLAHAPSPGPSPSPPAAPDEEPAADREPAPHPTPALEEDAPAHPADEREVAAPTASRRRPVIIPTPRTRPWTTWAALGAAAVLAGVLLLKQWQRRPATAGPVAPAMAGDTASTLVLAESLAQGSRAGSDSAAAVMDAPPAGVDGEMPATEIANPADSLDAAAYAVELVEFRSVTGATSRLEQEIARGLPAVTYAPVVTADTSRPMYRVIAGAYLTREQATALLRALRRRRVLAPGDGRVVRTPIALLIEGGLARDEMSFHVNGYRLKGVPVYPLVQRDGSVNLYAGAFDSAEAARTLLTTLRAGGEQPRVVYRTGRTP